METALKTHIRYLKRLELYKKEKPFQIFFDIPENAPDQRPDNLAFEEIPKAVHDIRPNIADFSLDDHGFMVKEHITELFWEQFTDREKVEQVYLPEIEALLRDIDPTINRVYFFDWRVSSSPIYLSFCFRFIISPTDF